MSFTLQTERHLPEINGIARLYVHDQTGARFLSIVNDDENKVFSICFRTPPKTSNGIAHIMEHSVLCGSRKYPVKEPFIELAKGSLNTFLNAFTFPDKTCYPVASQNLKDLYNLMDVYLDAVFYPLIPPETLMQEGWHYEIEQPDEPLTYKGVVFNEMKGAYSSPDDLLGDKSRQSLFSEGHPYALDSGGDPEVIPTLTYEEFKAFHETYYHPSNAYIWMYGDAPEEERLQTLDAWLDEFAAREVQSAIPEQPPFDAPRRVTLPYDAGQSDDAKAYVSVNWLLPDGLSIKDNLALAILAHILLATPASPLRKTLMDSGLGEDVIGDFEEHLRQRSFTAGMQGVQPENVEKVEALILDTLARLAREGLDADTVAASLNTIEFRLREQNTGRFPRGLFLMLNALTVWLYEGDPLEALAFEAPLAEIKAGAQEKGFFETYLQRYLLDNPHRSTVFLMPDPDEGQRRAERERTRLEAAKAAMSPDDLQRVIAQTRELKRRQEAPDSPEALASIPSLSLSDLDRQVRVYPRERLEVGGAPMLWHNLSTRGIAYLDLGFDLRALPPKLLPYIGLLGRALLQMGTRDQDFVQLTQRIGRETGGISGTTLSAQQADGDEPVLWFFLRGKTLVEKTPALLNILRDVLLTADFTNRERFRQIVLEEKSRAESALAPMGHRVVNQRLRAHFTPSDRAAEMTGGIEYLFFLRQLSERVETAWETVQSDLEAIRRNLLTADTLLLNLTADETILEKARPDLDSFVRSLPRRGFSRQTAPAPLESGHEGLTMPAQVNYVGKAANLYESGYRLHGSIFVINNYLGTTYLWEKIRVQGGAYGGFATFDPNSGVWAFLSYRDPNLEETLARYDGAADFLRELDVPREEIEKSIIGTIGSMDAYLLPDAKGWTSLVHYLTGLSDEMRQKRRDEVLGTTLKDFHQFAKALSAAAEQSQIVVLGAEEKIRAASNNLQMKVQKVL